MPGGTKAKALVFPLYDENPAATVISRVFGRAAPKYNHFIFMRSRRSSYLLLLAFLGGIALLRVHSSDDKKLSIYAPQLFYSLPVTQHDNKDYVQLFALMEPLAKTTLRIDGHTFHLRVNDIDGEVKEGKNSIKIGKTKLDMDCDLVVEARQVAGPPSSVTPQQSPPR